MSLVAARSASVLSAAVLVLFLALPASGHVTPERAEPAVGATLHGPPKRVRIWFDAPLDGSSELKVVSADGERVDRGDVRVDSADPRVLEVSLEDLSPGVYRVIWIAVSRDGHRTKGDYTFTVRKGRRP